MALFFPPSKKPEKTLLLKLPKKPFKTLKLPEKTLGQGGYSILAFQSGDIHMRVEKVPRTISNKNADKI